MSFKYSYDPAYIEGSKQAGVDVTVFAYRIDIVVKAWSEGKTYDIVLTEPSGAVRRKSEKTSSASRKDDGRFEVSLYVSELFPEADNPLKRPGMVTIAVSDGDQILSMKLDSQGFAEAQQFLRSQHTRLQAMLEREECDADCFLTTACCRFIGLRDDCFELRTLRAFRDGPLQRLRGGAEDVARYYAHAPAILAEMRRRNEEQQLLTHYLTHILPCAICAKLGFYWATRYIYRDLMRRLERRYLGANPGGR